MAVIKHDSENTGSRPITEVKQCRAQFVLGWVTAWEYWVQLAFCILSFVQYSIIYSAISLFSLSFSPCTRPLRKCDNFSLTWALRWLAGLLALLNFPICPPRGGEALDCAGRCYDVTPCIIKPRARNTSRQRGGGGGCGCARRWPAGRAPAVCGACLP